MTASSCQLEFITPCFCAGADPSHAEIRAPSIRGQLRWWFRVLGGAPDAETRVFGGVHGADRPTASALVVRCRVTRALSDGRDLPTWRGNAANDPLGYLCYFATVASDRKRWQTGAFFSPGTTFNLVTHWRQPIPESEAGLFRQTVTAWTRLGSLGMRQTRGLGALRNCTEDLTEGELLAWAATLPGLAVSKCGDCVPHSPRAWQEALAQLGGFLKGFRQDRGLKGKEPTVLGCSEPRLSSALHLRPAWLKEGVLPLVFYTARTLPDSIQRGRREVATLFGGS